MTRPQVILLPIKMVPLSVLSLTMAPNKVSLAQLTLTRLPGPLSAAARIATTPPLLRFVMTEAALPQMHSIVVTMMALLRLVSTSSFYSL